MVANQSQLWNISFVAHLHKSIDLVRNNFTGQMMIRRISPAVDFPVLAALCHIRQRNLMEIYDVRSENGVCVGLCEFINGTTLPDQLYDVKTAKQILCQICDPWLFARTRRAPRPFCGAQGLPNGRGSPVLF